MNNVALAWIQTSELLPTAPSFISSDRSDEVSLKVVSPVKAFEARLRMGTTSSCARVRKMATGQKEFSQKCQQMWMRLAQLYSLLVNL